MDVVRIQDEHGFLHIEGRFFGFDIRKAERKSRLCYNPLFHG